MPKQPTIMPRSGALPDSAATMAMASTVMPKSSGVPTASTSGAMTGMVSAMTSAPNSPPMSEAA